MFYTQWYAVEVYRGFELWSSLTIHYACRNRTTPASSTELAKARESANQTFNNQATVKTVRLVSGYTQTETFVLEES